MRLSGSDPIKQSTEGALGRARVTLQLRDKRVQKKGQSRLSQVNLGLVRTCDAQALNNHRLIRPAFTTHRLK